MVTATACLLCLVVPPSGMAYTMYLVIYPLLTAGTLHLTSATLGVTSLTVTSRGADGAVNSHYVFIPYIVYVATVKNLKVHLMWQSLYLYIVTVKRFILCVNTGQSLYLLPIYKYSIPGASVVIETDEE